MEDTDWAVTGLFSPSKARLAQAQAKDWTFVDAWLTKKYLSGRVPVFERNEDTLEALLALIHLNEAADERRVIVERVEKSALQYLVKEKSEPAETLLRDIADRLDQPGLSGLETLAHASLLLHSPVDNGMSELVGSAIELQSHVFESQQAERAAAAQIVMLEDEHVRLRLVLAYLQSDAFRPPSDVVEDTAQWTRGTKHLRTKIGEYDERLVTTRPAPMLLSLIEDTRKADLDISELKRQLADADADLETLRSFPTQDSDAQNALEVIRGEVQLLHTNREALLSE